MPFWIPIVVGAIAVKKIFFSSSKNDSDYSGDGYGSSNNESNDEDKTSYPPAGTTLQTWTESDDPDANYKSVADGHGGYTIENNS